MAKILDIVRKNKPKQPMWYTTKMNPEENVKLEMGNNLKCINWARSFPTL